MVIKYDLQSMKYMTYFERLTKAKVKDCFEDSNENLIFVVQDGEIGKALGKNCKTVLKLKEKLPNKKVKIVEYSSNLIKFIKNLIFPYKVQEINQEDDTIKLKSDDMKTKGLLIGKNGRNLRNYEGIVNRYFKIKEIKVE
jgi:transcription termination/antitermination protein NusA